MANIKQIINGDNKLIHSKATIEFTDSDLITLTNALFHYFKDRELNEREKELKDIIHIATQVSQYGHMDNWAVSHLSYVFNKENEAEEDSDESKSE